MGETRIVLDEAYLNLTERRKPGLKAALLAVCAPDFTPPSGQVALLYREWRRLVGPLSPQKRRGRRVVAPFLAGRLHLCRSCPTQPIHLRRLGLRRLPRPRLPRPLPGLLPAGAAEVDTRGRQSWNPMI